MRKRLRPFTLVELLIALSLTGFLFTTLFFSYRQALLTHKQTTALLWPAEQRLLLQQRLDEIIPEISAPCFTDLANDQPSLVFFFNNGIDQDPHFCGNVLARLYCSPKKQLVLATWPDPNRWKIENPVARQEVLFTDLETIQWRFYQPPNMDDPSIDPTPIQEGRETKTPDIGWNDKWCKEFESLPALVKLKLPKKALDNEEDLKLVYPVYQANKPIRCWHKKKSA